MINGAHSAGIAQRLFHQSACSVGRHEALVLQLQLNEPVQFGSAAAITKRAQEILLDLTKGMDKAFLQQGPNQGVTISLGNGQNYLVSLESGAQLQVQTLRMDQVRLGAGLDGRVNIQLVEPPQVRGTIAHIASSVSRLPQAQMQSQAQLHMAGGVAMNRMRVLAEAHVRTEMTPANAAPPPPNGAGHGERMAQAERHLEDEVPSS